MGMMGVPDHGPMGFGAPGGPPPLEALKSELGLSDEQVQKLQKLHAEHQEKMQASMKQLQEGHKAIFEQLQKDDPDGAAIAAAAKSVNAIRKQQPLAMKELHTQAEAVLTDEQKTKLKGLEEKFRQRAAVNEAGAVGLGGPGPHHPRGQEFMGPMNR